MKIKQLMFGLTALLALSGCYGNITTKVVDAETDKPIEGAVVLAEWTKTSGIGDTSTTSYKVVEAVTDKDGMAKIEGVYSILANYPSVTVYKAGYVAWNNERVFPGYGKRGDFKWSDGYVFRLEKFKSGVYKYCDHHSFLSLGIVGYAPTYNAVVNWELGKCITE